jgi:hypothetical protein
LCVINCIKKSITFYILQRFIGCCSSKVEHWIHISTVVGSNPTNSFIPDLLNLIFSFLPLENCLDLIHNYYVHIPIYLTQNHYHVSPLRHVYPHSWTFEFDYLHCGQSRYRFFTHKNGRITSEVTTFSLPIHHRHIFVQHGDYIRHFNSLSPISDKFTSDYNNVSPIAPLSLNE